MQGLGIAGPRGARVCSSSRPNVGVPTLTPVPARPWAYAPVDISAAPAACPRPQLTERSTKIMASQNGATAPERVEVRLTELEDLCTKSLKTLGYSDSEVKVLLEVLMYAQLRDNNQGIVKITSGGLNKHKMEKAPVIEKETRLSALINGNNTSGMIVLHKAMSMAIDRAREHGFGIVGTNHTPSSTGALGYYAEHIGKQGLIGLVLAQSPEFVAPHGSKQAIFGTNPIAISVPYSEDGISECVTMDMATAAYAWFGLLEAKAAGRPIPGNVALNAQGEATTDPSEVLSGGAIRVFDRSHKGSNLALMVELLAGPLVGAAVEDKLAERNWGNLVVAIDPALLGNPEVIKERVQVVLDRVKNATRLPGVDEILLPGERGNRMASSRRASGTIPIEPNLLASLRVMASKFGVPSSPGSPGKKGANPNGKPWGVATRLVHDQYATSVQDPYGGSGPPLWQTATFAQPSATTFGEYDYTRSGNPTRTMLEETFAALEGGDRGFAFTSGMAALAVVAKLVSAGEHILAGEDIYGGTSRLLANVVPAAGVSVSNVDMTNLDAVRAGIIPGKTKLVIVETPTNPRMQICDIKAIAAISRAAGAICCVDNSIMAATFQRPLDLGADICMTSGTKFVGGHGDVTLGLLTVKGQELAKRVYFLQNAEGAGLAPFDCWLALRGLKTMSLRMERAALNAEKMARFLAAHPLIKKVNYATLPGHPGKEIHDRQATSGGSLLSFETGSVEASKIIVEATQLFKVTVSFGSVTSLISLPCYMSHASIPAEVRAARGLPDDLVRISAGIEDAEDLISDLEAALNAAMAHIGFDPAHPERTPGVGKAAAEGNGNGNGSHGANGSNGGAGSAADREALLQRIAHLESLLQAQRR